MTITEMMRDDYHMQMKTQDIIREHLKIRGILGEVRGDHQVMMNRGQTTEMTLVKARMIWTSSLSDQKVQTVLRDR